MLTDVYAGEHSTCCDAAMQAFECAVENLALHRPVSANLRDALCHDPGLVAAHAMGGICGVLAGRATAIAEATAALPASQAALARAGGGTAAERTLVAAHALVAAGQLGHAAAVLEQHADSHPRDFLAIKLAYSLRFMRGEPRHMLHTVTTALAHWRPADAGYGFLMGCRAFALEESGDLVGAERAARTAIGLRQDDAWGLHALAHVMEMSGRVREGCGLMTAMLSGFREPQGFTRHLVWHLALFHVAQAEVAEALALLDTQMTPVADGDFRDMANAVSLLWRLEQHGLDVGHRWQMLGDIAARQHNDCSYVFAALHDLMALLRSGRQRAAADLILAMRMSAAGEDTDQARVAARVGVACAEMIRAIASGKPVRAVLTKLAARLPQLGGSHAQRDVFLRTLMEIAADSRDTHAFGALSQMRGEFRRAPDFWQSGLALELKSAQPRSAKRPHSAAALTGGMALS
jgi:hypothetical protein